MKNTKQQQTKNAKTTRKTAKTFRSNLCAGPNRDGYVLN